MSLPPLSRLTLGTAQFGSAYGIANESGCPSDAEVLAILSTARRAGITQFDTGRLYQAEERLGRLITAAEMAMWTKITKVTPVSSFIAKSGLSGGAAATLSIRRSLHALKVDRIDILMLHRADDFDRSGVMAALEEHVVAGTVGELGVSVYTPEEAVRCLGDSRILHLQVPFNLLDHRWLGGPFQQAIGGRPDVAVHARSVFLQGLLLHGPERWPSWVECSGEIAGSLDALAQDLQGGRTELCLRFVMSHPWVRTSVIGVDTAAQLDEIVAAAFPDALPAKVMARLGELAAMASPRLLNPALW